MEQTCWDFAFPDFTVPGGVWASWGPWLEGARWKESVTYSLGSKGLCK